ncbi:uncharacterized protein [Physcomitrium patens]|uniref:Uncharacterized protein n=2 Tax=Physcomitrium patens TaxID=3218 RepID=A0A7I3Z984_PHYPA|nr:uncharacterized protein LOC112277330 [Physcomitrium patens]XP_024365279.1 uncharacterized protein LOC112277330 [Physcomitrium patens]XP_024365287.1 uncharacterized protein LOC112277330 [Physcomitrium patens]XP_024365298.1 uncharacterized protein LOC112277330 [Physcomitrium patens]|eukprot:XP_024365270.1 uncharacterized protein LOC112277330 [Physcomitrella patens]
MKRKREAEVEGSDICKLGSEWASKRQKSFGTNKKAITSMGYKFMSSRPSVRRTSLGFHSQGSDFVWEPSHHSSKTPLFGEEEEDEEEDWISQIGAQYMIRKKLYETRGPLSSCSAYFSPREHEEELDNELDDSWIADFGMRWMKRRYRTRRGQYKFHDDAWLCELGFQWMDRVREREHSTRTWLSDLSSLYMTRRKQETDRVVDKFGSGCRDHVQLAERYRDNHEKDSFWETKRKLQYSDQGAELNNRLNPNVGSEEVSEVESQGKHEVDHRVDDLNASESLSVQSSRTGVLDELQVAFRQPSNIAVQEAKFKEGEKPGGSEFGEERGEVDASDGFQVLEFDPQGDLEVAQYVDLDECSSNSS